MYKVYQNLILEDELPFDYSYHEMNTPFIKEYSTGFDKLELSEIQTFNITSQIFP